MNDNKLNRPCKHFQLDFLVIGFNEVSCLSEGKNDPHSIDRKGYILFGKCLYNVRHKALGLTPGSYYGSCYFIFSFMCMFCRSLFVLFFWPLCCLTFSDLRIMIVLWYLQPLLDNYSLNRKLTS